MKKYALLAAGLVLVAGTAAGCGGGPPTDASTQDFCEAFQDFETSLNDVDPEAAEEEILAALQESAEALADVGTPEDMPDDAREGYELGTQAILDLDGASDKDFEKIADGFSDEDLKKNEAFDTYLDETCDDGGGDGGSEE